MEDRQRKSPDGLWHALDWAEVNAIPKIAMQLGCFVEPVKCLYEAGVQVSTLKGDRRREVDVSVAALFLKRSLNDLRSVWILLLAGYSSQAASVAASLYENALAAQCVAGNPERASRLLSNESGDLPWRPMELAKLVARDLTENDASECNPAYDRDYEEVWREIYAAYKWLCRIKHPYLPSTIHDCKSTAVHLGEYMVMAAPDTRAEDVPVKVAILTIAIDRCHGAIKRFYDGLVPAKERRRNNFPIYPTAGMAR